MAKCPNCEAEIEVAPNVYPGELVICENCGKKLELLETDPVMLAEVPSLDESPT